MMVAAPTPAAPLKAFRRDSFFSCMLTPPYVQDLEAIPFIENRAVPPDGCQ
jgi:hypothetical protein